MAGWSTGLPQALRRPGRGPHLPQRVAAFGRAPPGLVDPAGQLGAHRQRRPALRTADRAPGDRQGRSAMDQRGTGPVAQERQVLARWLRCGFRRAAGAGRVE
ncbi:hypothetical protein G6F68_021102 [Rhizopus microsporus]|nr:hypothetical protein G6F68_021102 [Rhizopus microsporus]